VGELDGRKVFLRSVVDLLDGGGDELLAGRTHPEAGRRRAEGARVLARQGVAGAVAWHVSLVKAEAVACSSDAHSNGRGERHQGEREGARGVHAEERDCGVAVVRGSKERECVCETAGLWEREEEQASRGG
jgi:hypothetical protein